MANGIQQYCARTDILNLGVDMNQWRLVILHEAVSQQESCVIRGWIRSAQAQSSREPL